MTDKPEVPPRAVIVPVETLEPFARVLCETLGVDPDEPQPPHGAYPRWYELCAPFEPLVRALLSAAPPVQEVKEDMSARMNPQAKLLRNAAAEIAKAGHAGWGNTCIDAAKEMDRLEERARRLQRLLDRYESTSGSSPDNAPPNNQPAVSDAQVWRDAIEAAAKICDERATKKFHSRDRDAMLRYEQDRSTSLKLAAAIRSLQAKGASDE